MNDIYGVANNKQEVNAQLEALYPGLEPNTTAIENNELFVRSQEELQTRNKVRAMLTDFVCPELTRNSQGRLNLHPGPRPKLRHGLLR
jgi:hypothetical protein